MAALQQVTELLLPNKRTSNTRSGHCLIPINDIRGVDGIRYTKLEKLLRCKLAAVYRLIDLYGWSENIYNHVTVSILLNELWLCIVVYIYVEEIDNLHLHS